MTHPLIQLIKSYLRHPEHWVKNIKWRFPSTISEKEIIFVVGSPRSGTTLLQRILTVHGELFSIEKETGIFSYQNIFTRKHFGLSQEETKSLLKESKDVVDFFSKSVEVLEIKNLGKRFVEKTPQHVMYLPFILKHFPKSKIVHVIRDGRDCFCSSLKHPNIPQKRSVKVFANYWKKCIRRGYKCAGLANYYEIFYEELASNPESELQNLMTFLNLDFQEQQLDPAYLSADKRSNNEVFKRLKEPINPSSVGRWRNELSEYEKRVFVKIAGKELKKKNYEG